MATPALNILGDRAPALGRDVYLGPAEVTELRGTAPMVMLPTGVAVRAEMALAFPYAPACGDTLLVIGTDEAHYVIGVLKAGGEVSLRFQGDVSLHAVGGALSLSGDKRVQVQSDDVEIQATKLRVQADSMVEKATSRYQRVREQLSVHAGEKVELVDGDVHSRSETASVVTRGIITINGKQVHLG